MPRAQTPLRIELTENERIALEQIAGAHSLPHRAVVRAQIILALVDGETIGGISRRLGRQRRIVCKWAERFIRKRMHGLDDAARSGRPASFPPGGRRASGEARVRAAG